jgi:hypothetical protein
MVLLVHGTREQAQALHGQLTERVEVLGLNLEPPIRAGRDRNLV